MACLTLMAPLILAQEVDVALEEDFNEAMLAMLRDLPMQDIYQVCRKVGCLPVIAFLLASVSNHMAQGLAAVSCCAGSAGATSA